MDFRKRMAIWWDDAADGAINMAADECLAGEAERRGGFVMRFYRWSATTVSIGGFQPFVAAAEHAAIRGLPIVRRPSGGGAIVHGSDLTYAAAVPKDHPWAAHPQALYDALHGTMVEVLAGRGVVSRLYRPGEAEASRTPFDEPFFCFDRRAAGDLVMHADPGCEAERPAAVADARGEKIMGSAQRRLAGVVLQHGTLLLRSNGDIAAEARHRGIEQLLPGWEGAAGLAVAWVERIAARLEAVVDVVEQPFVMGREAIVADRARRYRESEWTRRR